MYETLFWQNDQSSMRPHAHATRKLINIFGRNWHLISFASKIVFQVMSRFNSEVGKRVDFVQYK